MLTEYVASASLEGRLALLDERGHALLRVLRSEKLPEARGLGVQTLGMPALQRAIARRLRCRQCERALRAEQARDLQRLRDQLPRFEDRVHETAALRLFGADHAPCEDQFLRVAEGRRTREALRAAPARDDPEVDLRLAELGRAGGVAEVAGERELAAAAEGEAVDRRDRRLRHRLEQPPGLVPERAPLPRLADAEAALVLDVRTGGEGLLPRAGENNHALLPIAGEL